MFHQQKARYIFAFLSIWELFFFIMFLLYFLKKIAKIFSYGQKQGKFALSSCRRCRGWYQQGQSVSRVRVRVKIMTEAND